MSLKLLLLNKNGLQFHLHNGHTSRTPPYSIQASHLDFSATHIKHKALDTCTAIDLKEH